MKLKLLKTAVLALTGATLAVLSAKAATFTTDSNYIDGGADDGPAGDLILGVQSTGTGSTENYVVDLGQYTEFTPTATINFGTNGTVAAADLSTFGLTTAGTYTGSNANLVTWGVIGVTNADNAAGAGTNLTYINTVFATQTSNPGAVKSGVLNTAATDALNLAGNTYTSTANTNVGALVSSSASDSFASANTDPAYFGLTKAGEVSFGSSLSLNLYQIDPDTDNPPNPNSLGTTELLGKFTFTDGDLVFNGANAVPEPSTYVLDLGGMMLLLWMLKRRHLLNS